MKSSLVALLLVSSCVFSVLSLAQSDPQLTRELVSRRLASLHDSGRAEDSEIVTAYEGSRRLLAEAAASQRQAREYLDAMTTAPERQAEIQARMDAMAAEVAPDPNLVKLQDAEVEARRVMVRAELREATNNLDTLDRQLAARETNATSSRSRLAEIAVQIDALPDETLVLEAAAQPSLTEAQRWLIAAQYQALIAERRALDARLSSQPVRYSAMAVERAEFALQVERLSQQVRELESRIHASLAVAVDADTLGIAANDPAYEFAEHLAVIDASLREESVEVNEQLADVRRLVEDIDRQSRALGERYATARRVVEFASDSDVLGSVLLAYWAEIDKYRLTVPTRDISRKTGGTVIRRIELEETLKTLSSATAYINQQLENEGLDPDTLVGSSHDVLVELVGGYRDRLGGIIDAQSDYIEALSVLSQSSLGLTSLIKEYEDYLKSLVLWIPAYPALWEADGESASGEFAVLIGTLRDTRLSPSPLLLFGLILSGLLLSRKIKFTAYQKVLNKRISRPRDDAIIYTVQALACTALRALPVPLLLAAIASAITGEMVADTLMHVAVGLFVLHCARLICSPMGVGTVHFGWPEAATVRHHHTLGALIYYWLPLAAVVGFIVGATLGIGDAVIARGAILALLIFPLILLGRPLISDARAPDSKWLSDTPNQIDLLLITILLITMAAVAYGHVYSVTVTFTSLLKTAWMGFCLLLVHAVLMRWLRVTRRRLRLAELMEAREEREDRDERAPGEEIPVEERTANLGDVSAETSQLINVVTLSVAAFLLVYVWSPLLPAFSALDGITLWTSTTTVEGVAVDNRITLATLIITAFLASLTVFAARKLPALIDLVLRSQTSVSVSARYTVSTLVNYMIIGGGTLAAFSALGLQWSELQWLVAAMGVGIGFGLQEIIANFISGLIILFERPIRVGDIVSTGGNDGVVTRIRIRATTICDWDGKELLVPNKEFITGRLLNWSLSNPKIRTVIPVGIAYGSDVEQALKILFEITSCHPRVVGDPVPQIIFESFGDNALMLSARAYLDSPDNRMGVLTEINREIYRRFEEEGIVIAFPQRDVHFNAEKPIRITLDGLPASG